MSYVIGAVAVAALCVGWVLIQRWVAVRDPDIRGPESGCGGCGSCANACERRYDREKAAAERKPDRSGL